jgi:hypothetical protein
MHIISHRGFWKTSVEKNQKIAFLRSLNNGFGMETDLRDFNNNIVMSHDIPVGNEMKFDTFCNLSGITKVILALNIKSDGLAAMVKENAQKYDLKNWFVFDMSIPDMISHIKMGNPVFTRVSDVETIPCLLEHSQGIWLDAFYTDWFTTNDIMKYLNMNKQVCVVSPELHNRNFDKVWEILYRLRENERLILCTDIPDKATIFFK